MTDGLEEAVRALGRQERVGGVGLVRPPDRRRPRDRDGVVQLGPALGDQQVVPAVLFVQVRTFGVLPRFLAIRFWNHGEKSTYHAASAVPHAHGRFWRERSRLEVDGLQNDAGLRDVHGPVVVPE